MSMVLSAPNRKCPTPFAAAGIVRRAEPSRKQHTSCGRHLLRGGLTRQSHCVATEPPRLDTISIYVIIHYRRTE